MACMTHRWREMDSNFQYAGAVNLDPTAEERWWGNPHATFCGNRGRETASGDPVDVETEPASNQ